MPRGKKSTATPKAAAATAGIRRPAEDDIRNAVAQVNREKANAAEYTAMAGQATKAFCEKWSIDKAAFAFVRKLAAMAPQKRQATLIDTADLVRGMGFADQADLFRDPQAAVDTLALDDLEAGGAGDEKKPTAAEIKAATEAELAEAEPRMTQPFAETLRQKNKRIAAEQRARDNRRIVDEIGASINGGGSAA